MFLTANGRELNWSANANSWPASDGSPIRTGGQGNDIFYSGGAETLRGLGGDDTYQLYSSASMVEESASAGIDTVVAWFWDVAVLAANVENLILSGPGSLEGVGNNLDNIIQAGSVGALLWGMGGDDVLVGGAGADNYRIVAGQGSDAIVGFQHGWDAISLEGYGVSSFSDLVGSSSQVGDDVRINFANGEVLVLRDVELDTLQASDFNLRQTLEATGPDQVAFSGPATVLQANGWNALNNTWGSTNLRYGADYIMEAAASRADMTAGTAFSWSYGLTVNPFAPVLAYPEVAFGFSPFYELANPFATRAGFPASVHDIVSLDLAYDVTIGGNVSGFNVAYDLWFTGRPHGTAEDITSELMIWVHKGNSNPFGTLIGEYVDGDISAKIYHTGTYTALVLDTDRLVGTIDIVAIIDHLVALGIMDQNEYLSSIEFGSEVISGTGSLTINNFDFTLATRDSSGHVTVADVTGAGTTITEHDPVVTIDNVYQMGDSLGDIVDASGTDTIVSTISRDLNNHLNIENVTLDGAANVDATGNSLANTLVGNSGNNVLDGRAGADTLDGGAGNDRLVGGQGRDVLSGGQGHDTFVFNAVSESSIGAADRIADFTVGEDLIDVSGINALTMATSRPGGFCGTVDFSFGSASKIYLFHEVIDGMDVTRVELDTNRDGHSDFQVLLDGNINVTSSDFLF